MSSWIYTRCLLTFSCPFLQRLLFTRVPWPSWNVDLGPDAACSSRRQARRRDPGDFLQSGPVPGECPGIPATTEVSASLMLRLIILFTLGFSVLLRVLYQGYQEKTGIRNSCSRRLLYFVPRPLHVSAFTGHHQEEHTI
jgi:hypothetical protein